MDGLKLRALLTLLAVVYLLGVTPLFGIPSRTWAVALYILGLACVAGAGLLLVAVLAPRTTAVGREQLLFVASGLVAGDILLLAVLHSYAAYYINSHAGFAP